jgi:hypothetical protein
MKLKPTLVNLLRATCEQAVSLRKLLLLLKPTFSEVGSNRRAAEDETYRMFTTYLRAVAGIIAASKNST